MASAQFTEALRAELRTILDNDGQPFDINVAQRVYDFAISAKDLLTASVKSVEDVVKVIDSNGGPMESLTGADAPPSPEQASETFGARMMRELMAMFSNMMPHRSNALDLGSVSLADMIAAITNAKEHGLHELAAKLEDRLVGTSLERPKITQVDIVNNSYEHGFIDGSMQDNSDRDIVEGCCGLVLSSASPAYRAGFEAGRARSRVLLNSSSPPPAPEPLTLPSAPCECDHDSSSGAPS